MDKMTKRFALYLKDVIDYYKTNGSLRNFSEISKKHKITKLPQELFFKFGLDLFPMELFQTKSSARIYLVLFVKETDFLN